MKHTLSAPLAATLVLCLCPALLLAQITITSSDVQKPFGFTSTSESAEGPLTVDLGTTGGPQTWDFSGYSTSMTLTSEVVDPAGTPFAADFPSANQCLRQTDSEDAYTYTRVESNGWTWQGVGVVFSDSAIVQVWNPQGTIPLPVTYGSSWVFETGWADTLFGAVTVFTQRTHMSADAWGTAIIPSGSHDVLRIAQYDTSITFVSMPPFEFADTTTYIDYDWWGTSAMFVAEVSSNEGETNPNYTTASFLSRDAGAAGIGDGGAEVPVPRAFSLEQNAPNPFNPQTVISYTVPEHVSGGVELAVYSLRGQRVRTLDRGPKSPGRHSVTWNGRDDAGRSLPSGVYLYRLTAGPEVFTRKMMLAK